MTAEEAIGEIERAAEFAPLTWHQHMRIKQVAVHLRSLIDSDGPQPAEQVPDASDSTLTQEADTSDTSPNLMAVND